MIFLIVLTLILSLLIIFLLIKKKDKKTPLKYPFLSEVIKKSKLQEQQLYGDAPINRINQLELNNFIQKCREITGKDNICYKNVNYLSVDPDEMIKNSMNINYMMIKAILASLANPDVVVGLVFFAALVEGLSDKFKIFYDKDGNIDYVNIYNRVNENGEIKYILKTNKLMAEQLLRETPNSNIDVTLLAVTKPYYDSIKNRYNNGDFNDNSTNITLKFLIDVIMAQLSLGIITDLPRYRCDN